MAYDHDISRLLKPGEAYSHSFPIVAPNSREKYLVFLRFTAFHTVSISPVVNIVPNKIRAVFWRWSDGQGSYNRTVNVASNTTMDLFSLYKTQYYLSVRSALTGTNTTGAGWYDAGTDAPFAVNQGPNFFLLQSFDHWNWDARPGTSAMTTATAGSLAMDGPTKITAQWKFDYTYLAIVVGLITGFSAILTLLWKLHLKIRLRIKKIKS